MHGFELFSSEFITALAFNLHHFMFTKITFAAIFKALKKYIKNIGFRN